MKSIKLIFAAVITIVSLTAFVNANSSSKSHSAVSCKASNLIQPPNFVYSLSSQCKNTISRQRIHDAKRIADLIPDHKIQQALYDNKLSVKDVFIKIQHAQEGKKEIKTDKINDGQISETHGLKLLSTNYESRLFLEGYLQDHSTGNKGKKDAYFNYCMSVVPEKEAAYKLGKSVFIEKLVKECQSTIDSVQAGKLASGQIRFVVTPAGNIEEVSLLSSCGYPSVDKKMIDILAYQTEAWIPAENNDGMNIGQAFVFSFGQAGC